MISTRVGCAKSARKVLSSPEFEKYITVIYPAETAADLRKYYAPFVETRFPELTVSLLDFSP